LIRVANIVLPGKGIKEGPYVTEQELLAMADTAADEAVIEREERRLIHSIIDFGDTVAREVMVPRPDMVTVPVTASVHEAADVASSEGFSRIPVYGTNIDDIVGIAYLKDLMRAEREGRAGVPVPEVMRQAQFVPESKRIAEVMREMQAGKHHLAIVVDEYGGTAGLVTLEDVLEEHLDSGHLQVDGGLSIDEINELSGVELPQGDWDTVGGLVYSLLGHVPEEGEVARCDSYQLVAQKVEGRRIAQVLIGPVPPDDEPGKPDVQLAASSANDETNGGPTVLAGAADEVAPGPDDGSGAGASSGAAHGPIPGDGATTATSSERPDIGQAAAGR
jgi:putative hemolysin